MAVIPRQIGWSEESNLLWQVLKLLDNLYGSVGGLQGAITLTTAGNSGPATFISNILNVPEYTIDGLGGVPNTRTITINGNTQSLAADVSFTVLGTPISVVANYSALPPPATVPGAFYWAENSQGTYWLPGGMGGTFYNAGLYYSNGVVWQFMETPWQATQAEVDLGINFTKFVTPLTFDSAAKWTTKQNNITLTTTGTSGPSTFIADVLNIPIYSGATDLAYIASPIDGTVTSSTGTDAVITLAGSTNAGLMSPADFTKLQGLSNAVFTPTTNGLVPAPGLPSTGRVLSDNATWVTPAEVVSGGQTGFFTWKYQTTLGPTPGNGFFRADNASAPSVTTLYIADITSNNQADVSNLFANIKGDWTIYIQQRNDASRWIQYNTSVPYIDQTGYWEVPVTYVQQGPGGSIASSTDCLFTFINKNNTTNSVPNTRTININGSSQNLSADREWRTALADTGVLIYDGATIASPTQINIGQVFGLIVDNEGNPNLPQFEKVFYPGATNVTVPTLGTGLASYVLLGLVGVTPTIFFQNTFPTSEERKSRIYLTKISHPNGTINFTINEPDFLTSPLAQFRDLFQAFNYVNDGVFPFASSNNLSFASTAGTIVGNGINFVIDNLNPNKIDVPASATVSFAYRNQNGGSSGLVGVIDPTTYDNAGVTTVIGGGINNSTIQYIYYVPGAGFLVQRGQTIYSSFANAVSAVGKETFIVYPNLVKNALLIGVLAVKRTCTDLLNTADALFIKASKIGDITSAAAGGGGGGNLQSAYDASTSPEIITDTTRQAFTVRRGSAADTDFIYEGQNGAGATTYSVDGLGNIIQNSINPVNKALTRANLQIDKLTTFGNANYNVLTSDKVVSTSVTLTAQRTVQLPAPNTVNAGFELIVTDAFGGINGANDILVTTAAGTINGVASETIEATRGWRRFISDGVSNWSFDAAVVYLNKTQTLTNKRITKRVTQFNTTASLTPNCDTTDILRQNPASLQAGPITLAAVTGTPTEGQMLYIELKDSGAQRAITFTTGVEGGYIFPNSAIVPAFTSVSTWVRMLFIYNPYSNGPTLGTDGRWELISTV